jgi:hypothetical protein
MIPKRNPVVALLAWGLACPTAFAGCGETAAPAPGVTLASGASTGASTASQGDDAKCEGRPFVTVLDADEATPGTALSALAAGDASGTWAAGALAGGARFGTAPLASNGRLDAFVARLDRCGRARWARAYGGPGDETAIDLVADGAGGAYLLGTFDGTVDFGTGPVTGRGAGRDAFLLRLGPDGAPLWWKHVAALDGGAYVSDLGVDPSGGVLLSGHFEGEVGLGDATIVSGTVTGFAAKIDASAHTVWASRLGTAVDWEPLAIEAASDGGAFVAGADVRGVGLFTLRVAPSGSVAWSKSFRASGQFQERFFDLTVGPDDVPVLAGRGLFAQGPGDDDEPPFFVAGLGDGGAPSWVSFRPEPGARVARDRRGGDVFVAGDACEGGAAPRPAGCSAVLARLSPTGGERGSWHLPGDATVDVLEVDPSGAPLVGGALAGRLQIGTAEATGGPGDRYVARVHR